MTTKESIRDTAVRLFNEEGYENVSLRRIATEAGTTIGNLTYHFKKKEDLVIEIVSELHDDFSFFFCSSLKGKDLLDDLVKSFNKAEQNQLKYPFYFININELIIASDYFSKLNNDFQKRLYTYYVSCLLVLQEDEIIDTSVTLGQIHNIATVFISIITNWSTPSSVSNNPLIKSSTMQNALQQTLISYLNHEYKGCL